MPSNALKSQIKEARSSAWRTVVVNAAERVFAAHGYDAARIADIVTEADMALGTLYSVLSGKAAILQAVHEDRLADLFTVARAAVGGASQPTEMILRGNAAFIRWLADNPLYLTMNLREGYSWASSARYPSAVQVDAWSDGIQMMAVVFKMGMASGSIRPGDPETCARLVSAMQQVHVTRWAEADGQIALEDAISDLNSLVARSFFVGESHVG